MIIGLNLPTTYRIAQDLLKQIAGFGFSHVRVDVPPDGSLIEFVSDYAGAPVVPLFLLHDISRNQPLLDEALPQLGPNGFMVQCFNEPPGMDHVDVNGYIDGILAVHHDCRARGFTGQILMGGLANPGEENRDWLRFALARMPSDIVVDEHRYAYKTQDDWTRPWPPFADRAEEAVSLKVLAGGREVSLTETGWHTAEERIGWGPFGHMTQLTDAQCRDNLVKDFELYSAAGYAMLFVYQCNDGPGDSAGDRWGIRRIDGAWKPQADAVTIWRMAGG